VAGIAGALVATFAMCGPSAVLAYFVSNMLTRSSQSIWPAILQAALVPVTTGGTWAAVVPIVGVAALALATRLNPLWMLIVGGILGFAGVV
jgi:chromate transporter